MVTAQSLYERSLRAWPERVAVVDGERRLTYARLEERSSRLANVFLAYGASESRPAASYLPNRAEFVEFDVACTRAGITRLGISDRLAGDEVGYILRHSGAAVLLTTPALRDRLDELPPDIAIVALPDGHGRSVAGAPNYESVLAAASPALSVPAAAPDAPNYILYTSGTTGRPKGALHTQLGRARATLNMLANELSLDASSVIVHAAPLTHGSGSKVIAVLAVGGTNVILPRFDTDAFADAVEREGATHTFAVPTMLQRLDEGGARTRRAAATLRQISFGGSPISRRLFARVIDAFGSNATQVYGSCEAPHPVTVLRPCDYADGREDVLESAGRASIGVDLKVVDDGGATLGADATGELLIRSGHLMRGYWHDPDATAAAFDGDWYRSGDLASIDERGFVTFRDRKRDLIITGGLNVYPSEVERVLAEHAAVKEVAVLGYADDEWGESVAAYVVRIPGRSVSADELIDWSRKKLASYKKPRRVEFVDALPLGASNKVLKRELRDALRHDDRDAATR